MLRVTVFALLAGLAIAGPVPWDDTKCSKKCDAATSSKYQYSSANTYLYNFETSNVITADGTSDLSMGLQATLSLTPISSCEMVLQVIDVKLKHGTADDTSSSFINELRRHPLPFSWSDGLVEEVCPNPGDSSDINNFKKSFLSAIQNSMKSFDVSTFEKEVDILGSCDTEYKVTESKEDKYVISKIKNIASCTRHLKGHTVLLATPYESAAQQQHLPFLTGETLSCVQTIENGIVEKVICDEKASFKPLKDYGYVVDTEASLKLEKTGVVPAKNVPYRAPFKEDLVYRTLPSIKRTVTQAELENVIKQICENTKHEVSAPDMHKLVYTVRGLNEQSLEKIYQALKNKQLCSSGKTLNLYMDALRAASSGGAIGFLAKLFNSGEMSEIDAFLWFALMPFKSSHLDENSIQATIPLLKNKPSKQALLGVSALTYKFCHGHGNCENLNAVKEVSSNLQALLGDKCKTGSSKEETNVITALKAFGNLGFVDDNGANAIFECIKQSKNKMSVRIAAVEAFRRTPSRENIVAELFEIYKNVNLEDELRIAALLQLTKVESTEIIRGVLTSYKTEPSNQVKVFTWSYLNNLRRTSDPMKSKISSFLFMDDIKAPFSTDITKFSRNMELSLFLEQLNLGSTVEGNLIYSKESYLARSMDFALKTNIFGNQLDLLQFGGRLEGLDHLIEKLFGPHGLYTFRSLNISDSLNFPANFYSRRSKRSTDSKIDALSERLGYSRNKVPQASAFVRVLGHELEWINFHKDMFADYKKINFEDILQKVRDTKEIDFAKNLLYLDVDVIFPSITGRGYKLAANSSLTFGLKTNGKIELEKSNINFEGNALPSIQSETTATFTIISEDFAPGVKVHTELRAGLDFKGNFMIKDGRLLHFTIDRNKDKQELLTIKRRISSLTNKGEIENVQPKSYELNYCTKYIQTFLGAKYCISSKIPHFFNEKGQFKIPLVRALETAITVEKTDVQMKGYEVLIELPDFEATEKRFRLLTDTPGSSIDRKFSLDINCKKTDSETSTLSLNAANPFYSLEMNADVANKADKFKLKIEAMGNKKRKYSVILDVAKDVRGPRLVEYSPQIAVRLPNVKPIDLSGTIVYAKGRKEQVTMNFESASFEKPLTIKGNFAKEGALFDLESYCKLYSSINVTAFSQIHRFEASLGNELEKGVFYHLGYHVEPEGKSYESVTLLAKMENIELRDRLQFSLETKVLLAKYEHLNSHLRWDFSVKPFSHWKDELVFRYGRNFEDEKHLVRFTHISALHGDFYSLQRIDFENKLGLTISCLNFDKSVAFSVVWDLISEDTKVFVEIGAKNDKEREVSLMYNYKRVHKSPLKIASKGKYTYYDYNLSFENSLNEISSTEYHGKYLILSKNRKETTVDYILKRKSASNSHFSLEGTVNLPDRSVPIKISAEFVALSSDNVKFNLMADAGHESPYSLNIKYEKDGTSEMSLASSFIDGKVSIQSEPALSSRSLQADVNVKGGKAVTRRVVISGKVAISDVSTLDLDVHFDADKNADKKVSLKAKSNKDINNGGYVVTAAISYEGSAKVDVTGKLSSALLIGPHYLRADFSGDNTEPVAIEFKYEVKDKEMKSATIYFRNNVEKLKLDVMAKYKFSVSHNIIEGGMFLSSPYKTFDGKEIYFRIMGDSNKDLRVFIAEYRIKPASVIGYLGKLDYERTRGWPGQIKSNLLITVHQRPITEGTTKIEYGNGKYSWKTSFTPARKDKIHFLTSFEHAANFAAFHHSVTAGMQYIQKVELNAVADLRNMEDTKLVSNFDVNEHQVYDINSTLKMRSIVDFDYSMIILSKITPSFRIFSKSTPSGEVVKYHMDLEVDKINLVTGSGELKKRKKGLSGDIVYKYKEREILSLNIKQDAKTKTERSYMIKAQTPWRSYTTSIKINKEKKNSVKFETKFCRMDPEMCINIDAEHKTGDNDEWQIKYRRGEVEFNIERIRVITKQSSRFQTVIYNGDKRYGYDLILAKEDPGYSISLGIIIPSRKIVSKSYAEFSFDKPRLMFEFSTDALKHPERKLVTDLRFQNHLLDNSPSKLDLKISHEIFEKSIEMTFIGDYRSTSKRFLIAEMFIDYTLDPNDKLILKAYVEAPSKSTKIAQLKMFHKDEENLDFSLKLNGTRDENEVFYESVWLFKNENDEEQEAYTRYQRLINEGKFNLEYKRPKVLYKLEGTQVKPKSLIENSDEEVSLVSTFNGASTKATLYRDFKKHCDKLLIFREDGKTETVVHFCFNYESRKILSLDVSTLDEDEMSLVLSTMFVRKSWRKLNFRNHIDPDFLGKILFKLTSFGEKLSIAEVGSLPFYNSPGFKNVRKTFHAKIFQPTLRFVIPEAARFVSDVRKDTLFLSSSLKKYYSTLPTFQAVKSYLENACNFLKAGLKELSLAVSDYYKEYFKQSIEFITKAKNILKAICNNNKDCSALKQAYNNGGFEGLLKELRILILSLPGKIQEFLSHVEPRKVFDSSISLLKVVVAPMKQYKCGAIIVDAVELLYTTAEPYIQLVLDQYPTYYRQTKSAIMANIYVQEGIKLIKETYFKVKEMILNIDYMKFYTAAKKQFEEYLLNVTPPSIKSSFTVNQFNSEKGLIDIDLNMFLSPFRSLSSKLLTRFIDLLERLSEFNVNKVLVTVKRTADLNFFPPYEAQAMIVGNHFITFDSNFFDFAGECSYLLSRDFEDGNFTFVLKPKETHPSLEVLLSGFTIELNRIEKTVKINENEVDLPYHNEKFAVLLSGSTIIIDDLHGVKATYNLVYDIVQFSISGFYFGKTAGLLGIYNYEEFDDFRRPKGLIANSVNVHAKSWELNKGCKSTNLVPENVRPNDEVKELCSTYFENSTSPLSACFGEVSPKEFLKLCERHLSISSDKDKSLCSVAGAYIMQCENNYVELNLPKKCLTCTAPDGSVLEHGDRKKYEKLVKKFADIIFIIEDSECNKAPVNDIGSIAKNLERELENEHYKDVRFGVVGYGGKFGGRPETYSVAGKSFFTSKDISAIKGRMKLEKGRNSSFVFEALKLAVNYIYRADSAKSFVLMTCSACKYDFKSIQYPVVQQALLERAITLHVINNGEIKLKKTTKEKDIIGVDPDTVYHSRDVTQKDLRGEPSLRSQVILPKDLCIALSQDVSGSFFSSHSLGSTIDTKNWRSVFARKFAKSINSFSCQYCDCISTRDHIPNTVCEPCEPRRPRLPFSVRTSLPRTVESFLSYVLHMSRL